MTRRTVDLSPRETDVLDELLTGQTNLQIGESLGISVDTVKAHMKAILAAFGARDRTEAVVWVLSGQVTVDVTDNRGRWARRDRKRAA